MDGVCSPMDTTPHAMFLQHMEGVCEVKHAAQGATPSSCSVWPHFAAPCYKSTSTLQSLWSTPVFTVSFTDALIPQITAYSCGPKGTTPRGLYIIRRREATAAAPLELFRSPFYTPWTTRILGLPHHHEPCSGGTLTPASTGSVNVSVLVGGLEWLVDPWVSPLTSLRPLPGVQFQDWVSVHTNITPLLPVYTMPV